VEKLVSRDRSGALVGLASTKLANIHSEEAELDLEINFLKNILLSHEHALPRSASRRLEAQAAHASVVIAQEEENILFIGLKRCASTSIFRVLGQVVRYLHYPEISHSYREQGNFDACTLSSTAAKEAWDLVC
jgi:hypothetical protein